MNKFNDNNMRKNEMHKPRINSRLKFNREFIRGAVLLLMLVFATASYAAENLIVSDPLHIGVGARPLGMGKAYVALAEDGDGIFVNPAGLGKVDGPKITSMYSSVLGEVNYIVLGGAYPHTKNSAIGAGAVVSSVSGIDLYDTLDNSNGTANWSNSVMFLSYGVNLEDARLQLGGSVKYFNQGGTGSSTIESASASSIGMDLGAIYSPSENLSLGVVAQNPFGTKLESGNGVENTMLSTIKAGAKMTFKPFENQKINLAIDADMAKHRPTTMHLGAEY